MHIILIVIVVIVFIIGQSIIYDRLWNKKLNVSVDFSKELVEEREEFKVIETVENRKKLPLPALFVKFSTTSHLEVCGIAKDDNAVVSDKFYYSDVIPVMGNKLVTRKIRCHANKRGVYLIDSLHLSSRSLLMDSDMHEVRNNDAKLLVYPKHFNRAGFDIPFNTLFGEVLTKLNLIEDPFMFRGLRDYSPGDAMNRINWKASAKSDSYVVNHYNQSISRSVTVCVDFSHISGRSEDELMEESLRLLVSLSEELLDAGFAVKVVSNALNQFTGEETIVLPCDGALQMENIHIATASIDINQNTKLLTEVEDCANALDKDSYLILISCNQDEDLIDRFIGRIENGLDSFWIVPVNYNVKYNLPSNLNDCSCQWNYRERIEL